MTVDPNCRPSGSMVVNGTAEIVVTGGGMFSNAGPCESPNDAFVCQSNDLSLTVCDEWTAGSCTTPGTRGGRRSPGGSAESPRGFGAV